MKIVPAMAPVGSPKNQNLPQDRSNHSIYISQLRLAHSGRRTPQSYFERYVTVVVAFIRSLWHSFGLALVPGLSLFVPAPAILIDELDAPFPAGGGGAPAQIF